LSTLADDPADYSVLSERLGYRFKNVALVAEAMAHRSWCAEHPGQASNERLEFLGDALLGWIAADVAFKRFTEMSEGQLTGIRKGVVNTAALAELAVELGLGPFIKLGKGETAAGGASKPSILADALEALIGAVYLDGDALQTYKVVASLIDERIAATAERLHELDFKSTLQELVASTGLPVPVYELSEQGPDHDKRFFAAVYVDGEALGTGEGRSKRTAEQEAASVAARSLAERERGLPHRSDIDG
jgi:ribonuclease-3